MHAAARPKPPCGATTMPTPAPISRSKAWRSNRTTARCSTCCARKPCPLPRPDEHTSELQSLMRNSYAAFCSKTKHQAILLQYCIHNHPPPAPSKTTIAQAVQVDVHLLHRVHTSPL